MNLPEGQDYVRYADLNVIVLSTRLDCAGRERAIADLQAQWRREHLQLIHSA